MLRHIDASEVKRDLVNWMDVTSPGWRGGPAEQKRLLLERAKAYFADVSRRYRIADEEFLPPLEASAESLRAEHGF